ncbi:MAG: hypothetical protein HW389_3670 [Bacteroidetes bacterium]|nr:hypothetical protein [Bacteroidota bacterium]
MNKITVWFIKCAMVYFLAAVILGLYMLVSNTLYPYMPIHAHFNLLGWISMMIYGVAYHVLPRFSGKPLYSDRLAEWQFWFANIGLLGMSIGWLLSSWQENNKVLLLFAIIEVIAIVMFVINMFNTLKITQPIGK